MDKVALIEKILKYWFGDLSATGWVVEENQGLWFGSRPEDDQFMHQQFSEAIEQVIAGDLNFDKEGALGSIALIILCDQMRRATHRASPQAFDGDEMGLRTSKKGVSMGYDKQLPPIYRRFYYLPFEHSESLEDQKRGVALFQSLAKDYPQLSSPLNESVHYAQLHLDIIARFGRFPHRNAILGRESTTEENDYLAQGAPTFGQG